MHDANLYPSSGMHSVEALILFILEEPFHVSNVIPKTMSKFPKIRMSKDFRTMSEFQLSKNMKGPY